MDRRQFLAAASIGALAAATPAGAQQAAAPATTKPTTRPFGLDSPPVLQNPEPSGVTVAWAVNGLAAGWVEYGPTPDLGRRAQADANGLLATADRMMAVRLTGLTPGEPVFYRTVAAPVTFRTAYDIVRGEPAMGTVYRYTPPPLAAADAATFAVINDTHETEPTLRALTGALAQTPADFTVYNGDIFNDVRGDDQVVKYVLRPAGAAYAAERPLLFTPGNHDHRGYGARGLSRALTPWAPASATPRCFALRTGPVAVVGVDTGEDKPDRHPVFAGLAAFEPYREAQRDWLAAALKRPEIASAPYLVVFAHIPLWGHPGENGGDTMEGYGSYNAFSQRLWHPLLAAAGAQIVISGHTHKHRYDPPAANRPYAQLVGGGPTLPAATLIRGRADKNGLELTAAAAADGKELGRWTFRPRGV